jgi:hypothetical protein
VPALSGREDRRDAAISAIQIVLDSVLVSRLGVCLSNGRIAIS